MPVQCREILNLPSLRKAVVAAGKSGLNRSLRWIHVLEVPDVTLWAESGDLLLTTGVGLKNDLQALPKLIREMEARDLAGLLVALGPYIPQLPEAAIDLANTLNFPVITLPWEVRFVDVTREAGNYIVKRDQQEKSVNHLLEDILFNRVTDSHSLANQIAYCGYDFNKTHQIMVILIESQKMNHPVNSEEADELAQYIRQILARHDKHGPLVIRANKAIALVNIEKDGRSALLEHKEAARDLQQGIMRKWPDCSAYIGIGAACHGLPALHTSFEQAVCAVEFARGIQEPEKICSYEEMGIYKLLTGFRNRQDLEGFSAAIIKPLRTYDAAHGTNIVGNVLTFLEENGNVVKAAKRLFLHRNTLQYRLQKVEELTGLNLERAQDRLSLHIALLSDGLIRNNVHS